MAAAAMSGQKDFLTNLDVNLPGGTELTWEKYEDVFRNHVFEEQYKYAMNEIEKELEKQLGEAMDEELENLGMKADADHGPTQAFLALMARMDQLEEDLKKAPPDRMGQYMQCCELQQGYLDRLSQAMKAQAILQQGQVNIDEKLSQYKKELLRQQVQLLNEQIAEWQAKLLELTKNLVPDHIVLHASRKQQKWQARKNTLPPHPPHPRGGKQQRRTGILSQPGGRQRGWHRQAQRR